VRKYPNNSNLYVNRALFLSQLGHDEEAIRDIEKAIKINPRNYIAYFNLFSILTKLVEDDEALSALCCSLSCLYLIRGKLTKNLEDAEKSIAYCNSNTEAHVLKGLLLMQKEKYG
jgi:tetratricopeptide (TPR) repeat protein